MAFFPFFFFLSYLLSPAQPIIGDELETASSHGCGIVAAEVHNVYYDNFAGDGGGRGRGAPPWALQPLVFTLAPYSARCHLLLSYSFTPYLLRPHHLLRLLHTT